MQRFAWTQSIRGTGSHDRSTFRARRAPGEDVNPLLVILDLDETLVHGTEHPLARPADLRVGPYFVYQRPHLTSFLSALRERCSLAIWTSAGRDYAHGV